MAVLKHYRALDDVEGGEVCELSSAEIFRTVMRHHSALLADIRQSEFGKQIARLFPVVKRQGHGNLYRVVPLDAPLGARHPLVK